MVGWIAIGLPSLLGALTEVTWGVAFHGFWQKDYDPETIFFSFGKVVQAPIVTLVAFGAGSVVLPVAFQAPAPLTALPVALAILCGYYSYDLLDAVHRGFTRVLGGTPSPVSDRPLPKTRNYPLDALIDHPLVTDAVPGDLRGAVQALRAAGAATTGQLLGMRDEALGTLAAKSNLDAALLTRLRGLAKQLDESGSLEDGVRRFVERYPVLPKPAEAPLPKSVRVFGGNEPSGPQPPPGPADPPTGGGAAEGRS
jgi:hypothetical protein